MSTATLTPDMIKGISMVGRVVTVGNDQYKIHSVEGTDWYAFDDQGTTTVDFAMAKASWITFPLATIIPSGHKIGDGLSTVVALDQCRPGVCLSKSYV